MYVTDDVQSEELVKSLEQGVTKVLLPMSYSWYFFHRENDFSCLLRPFKLIPKYVVDQFFKAEAEKLSYLRKHQRQLGASNYSIL